MAASDYRGNRRAVLPLLVVAMRSSRLGDDCQRNPMLV
jgi:hypothetical protein